MTRQHSVLNNIMYTPNFSGMIGCVYCALGCQWMPLRLFRRPERRIQHLSATSQGSTVDDPDGAPVEPIAGRHRREVQSVSVCVSRIISQWLDFMEEKMRC
ncbi:unnamed protein product [Gadus morhua 'NCC']